MCISGGNFTIGKKNQQKTEIRNNCDAICLQIIYLEITERVD